MSSSNSPITYFLHYLKKRKTTLWRLMQECGGQDYKCGKQDSKRGEQNRKRGEQNRERYVWNGETLIYC